MGLGLKDDCEVIVLKRDQRICEVGGYSYQGFSLVAGSCITFSKNPEFSMSRSMITMVFSFHEDIKPYFYMLQCLSQVTIQDSPSHYIERFKAHPCFSSPTSHKVDDYCPHRQAASAAHSNCSS